jgi:protein ImuA
VPSTYQIAQLKTRLASLSRHETGGEPERFLLGIDRVDAYLDPGPCLFCLHDIHARTAADAVAANAFALGLATRATRERPMVWVFQNLAGQEAGGLNGSGLHEWGVRDATAMLAAGEEALKSGAVGSVLMSGWGEARAMSLTASRRLALAARAGGSTAFVVRAASMSAPSAAETRWSVASALSTGLEAGVPGRPAFVAALTRSRQGAAPAEWTLEWDRERRAFCEPAPLSGRRLSVPVPGSAASRGLATGLRRTG